MLLVWISTQLMARGHTLLSSSAVISTSGTRLGRSGIKLAVPAWKQAYQLSGASNWWNRAGIVTISSVDYFTNSDPDQGAIGQANIPGGRACLYQDIGTVNYEISVTWTGDELLPCGPTVCITPADTAFGLNFCYEDTITAYVLWKIGRQPSDVAVLATSASTAHTDGVDVVLKMVVSNGFVTCYADGVEKIAATAIPSGLVASTIVGVNMDVNPSVGRPANQACLVSPATIVRR